MGSITMVKHSKPRKKVKQAKPSQALVISEVSLTQRQTSIITAPTPPEFVKERQIRGGGKAKYVEVGYIVAKLNEAFGPLNWNWEIVERGYEGRKVDSKAEGEVWVRGRLTIKDHKNGYEVNKEAFGQHPVYPGVPYGDALKAAGSDALKKAASSGLGIALDVYWKTLDEEPKKLDNKGVKIGMPAAEMYQRAKQMIGECQDPTTLGEWRGRINASKHYGPKPKADLIKLIDGKIEKKTN